MAKTSKANVEIFVTDPIRKMIIAEARNKGFTFKNMSDAIGRNESYVQQFLFRGSPRKLAPNDLENIAKMLDLPKDLVQANSDKSLEINRGLVSSTHRAYNRRSQQTQSDLTSTLETSIPVFSDDSDIDLTQTKEYIDRPDCTKLSASAFALWVTQSQHPRLRCGDLLYVGTRPPARPGDMVVVLDGAKIHGIGEMISSMGDAVEIELQPDRRITASRTTMKILKVASVKLA
jgi:hypothetical protein